MNIQTSSSVTEYPRFLTIEGIEGAGKSTAVDWVRTTLADAGHEVVVTREPGGTPMAERIRTCMLADAAELVRPETELLLMFAARVQHVHNVILPALHRGAFVVCDRFTCSSYAYQGAGRGLESDLIRQLEFGFVGIAPSLTLYLDVEPTLGLKRAADRGGKADRMEAERIEFFVRAREGFIRRAMEFPARYSLISSAQPINMVERDIRQAVLRWRESYSSWGEAPTTATSTQWETA